jgi:hypothetical protein
MDTSRLARLSKAAIACAVSAASSAALTFE